MTNIFERFLSVWVSLCIFGGIILGKTFPGVARYLDGLAIYVEGAPVVSIPIATCLFLMMYPIVVKIDFGEVVKAGKSGKPVSQQPSDHCLDRCPTVHPNSVHLRLGLRFGTVAQAAVRGRGTGSHDRGIESL